MQNWKCEYLLSREMEKEWNWGKLRFRHDFPPIQPQAAKQSSAGQTVFNCDKKFPAPVQNEDLFISRLNSWQKDLISKKGRLFLSCPLPLSSEYQSMTTSGLKNKKSYFNLQVWKNFPWYSH